MKHALKRRIALLLVGLLVFSQASVVLAACSMDRAMLGQSMASTTENPCSGCDTSDSTYASSNANVCVAHCTSDLQLAGFVPAIVPGPAALPALPVLRPAVPLRIELAAPPLGAPPHRILLHSF